MTAHLDQRGFAVLVPEGFIELPLRDEEFTPERFAAFREVVAQRFGLDAGDEETAGQAALGFATMGAMAGAERVGFAAVAVYRSAEDPERLVMVWLTVTEMPSAHETPEVAVAGLLEAHRLRGGEPHQVRLTSGPAVLVVTEEPLTLHVGADSAPVLRREVTAWAPDPFGTRVAVLSLATNSWQDWAHVCELALEVFDSLDWAPPDTGGETGGR